MTKWNNAGKLSFTFSPQCFFTPRIDRSRAYSFWFVHLSVCLSAKNFYIGHIFRLVRIRAFIFHTSIPCDKTFWLVPSSRSSVKFKVKYQGHSFRKKKKKWSLLGYWCFTNTSCFFFFNLTLSKTTKSF